MCESNDDDKKSASAKPKPKPAATSVPPNLPDDIAFKKPSIPRAYYSSTKKLSATTQKLATASSASKRQSPAPTPPPSKKPSPPIGTPSKKSFPPPTPPPSPSPPPTPPPTPPSPPKPSSGIPISLKKRPTALISPTEGQSSSPKSPAPKRPSSLPTGKRLLPAFNLERLVVSPPIPEPSRRPPGPASQTSSPPTKIPVPRRAAEPEPILEGSLLARMLAPGSQAPIPRGPSVTSYFVPPPAPFRPSPPRDHSLGTAELEDAMLSLSNSLNIFPPYNALGAMGEQQRRPASPEGTFTNFGFDHRYPRIGPKTPPSSPPMGKRRRATSPVDIARPERPQNPAFGRPASLQAGVRTPPPGEVITHDGIHYEVVTVFDTDDNDEDTMSPIDINVTSTTAITTGRSRDGVLQSGGLQFFSGIRKGLVLPPPYTTSHQCDTCTDNDREECKNCHQLQPICRLCPCCDNYRHFACFEEGCYNPSYWLSWICRYCPRDNAKANLDYMRQKINNRALSGKDPEEAEKVYSEHGGNYAPAGKENTPPISAAKKRPLKLDVPQLLDNLSSTMTSPKKFKKSTTPSKDSTTPKKSPLAATKNPSTPNRTPTKSPLQTINNSPARPALREISPSQNNRMSASPKASTSTLYPSPKASTSRVSFSPKASPSRMSASPKTSTSTLFSSPKASTSRLSPSPKSSASRMYFSPKASTSRMSDSPKASTSTLFLSPKASTSRMSFSPQSSTSRMSASPNASTSTLSASPRASTSRMSFSPKASTSGMVTPEKPKEAQIRLPLNLDFSSPEHLVSRYMYDIPVVPAQLAPVKSICERCHKTQPIMRNCFICQEYVNGRICGHYECCDDLDYGQKVDLHWYCTVCIKNYRIPRLALENFCYACLTPMPLARNCHHCGKFYIYHCDFPYKCIVAHYPSYMMYSRWNHCEECLDANLGGYVEPLKVAELTTNLEPWHEDILSISMNAYNVSPLERFPSVKRTLNLDEGDLRCDPVKKIHLKWY